MKVKTIPSAWMRRDGRRFDCGPYMSGALEAKIRLEELDCRKDRLADLTAGHDGGIYNGPQFARNYVDDVEHGVRFLGTSSMLRADLSKLPLLRKRDALSPKLAHLRIEPGMTLISCSGTIGRMVYARPDMIGMWSNQDMLKVVADPERVRSGFLYAFLSCKFGVPLVTSGTYGAIIQHIEPQHIADLPVPRFGQQIEDHIHNLVERSSSLLAEHQELLEAASGTIFTQSGAWNPSPAEWHRDYSDKGFAVNRSELSVLRAWNLSRRAHRICSDIKARPHSLLGELIDLDWLRWRVMFKRIDADPEHGIEVMTQKPIFQLIPKGRWVSRRYMLNLSERYIVPDRTVIVAKQGTLGEHELFCRCEYITGERALDRAYSDHCMRVVADPTKVHPGYLFAFLRSNAGFRVLRSLAEGGKQQDLHWKTVPNIPIPRLTDTEEAKLGEMVDDAYSRRNRAVDLLLEARSLVERAIEEAA